MTITARFFALDKKLNMFEKLKTTLRERLENSSFAKYIAKIWVYNNSCLVVDFGYSGVNFNFDINPIEENKFSLDLVQRKPVDGVFFTPDGLRKYRLSGVYTLNEIYELIEENFSHFINRVDAGVNKSLRIGVITLPLNKNFGGNLQAFALTSALRNLGHRPLLINRRHASTDVVDLVVNDGEKSEDYVKTTYGMSSRISNSTFIDKHIREFTKKYTSSIELSQDLDNYAFDAVIVGSDQVWRAKYARNILSDLFLGFLPEKTEQSSIKRISYAASFGSDKLGYSGLEFDEVADLIKKFDAVSVREDSGVELLKRNFDVTAEHVIDPTLLLDQEDYLNVFKDIDYDYSADRLLTYVLDADPEKEALISKVCSRIGLQGYSTNGLSHNATSALKNINGDASIENWLASFYNSKFVITDSFHGTVFAIIFNKPFIAYGNQKRGLSRFTSLLKMFDLEDRLIVKGHQLDVERLIAPMDWDKINKKLHELRESSINFLKSALKNSSQKSLSSATVHMPKSEFSAKVEELASRDVQRYINAIKDNKLSTIRAKIMFSAHALEKGLSHQNFRPGFGHKALNKLSSLLKSYIVAGGDLNNVFFGAALSVLKTYFLRHREIDFNVSSHWALFSSNIQSLVLDAENNLGGVFRSFEQREIISDKLTSKRSFTDVIYGRRSIREYTDDSVEIMEIESAVHIATQSPSVCNRQGVRVHCFTDKEKIRQLVDLQGGFGGYKKPPVLLLVTAELSNFYQAKERNQAYIDGGIFLMSLLLGLENSGLAACPLNTMMDIDREKDAREVLAIPESEVLISFVALGKHSPAVLVPRSARYAVNEVMKMH